MRHYELISEADARLIPYGETIGLNTGGHITPLAQDTLRERRVVVIHHLLEPSLLDLTPHAEIGSVALATDHSGVTLKNALRNWLRRRGVSVTDLGTDGPDPVDYPDIAASAARLVARREVHAGIVIDGAGLGSAIAANKVNGIRAAMCANRTMARYAREHNGTNVLTLGAQLVTVEEAVGIVEVWLDTPMREARYIRRLAKIAALETSR